MTTVRECVLEVCRTHGLTTWFGNPGSSELTLLQDFPDDFRYFLGLQEMVPVGMADGYAQLSRRPVLVNVHTAPGMGNAMGAIYNAAWNKTPLIVTAGNQRRTMQNQQCLLTNVDATLLPRPFVKWAGEPAIASEVPAVLSHAIHIALTPPMGPVFVSLPMDDMSVELDDEQVADVSRLRGRTVAFGGGLSAACASLIANRLGAATAPALVVGGDVERSGAFEAVINLAERAGAAVYSAPLAGLSGFPQNHPLYQGQLAAGAGWIADTLAGNDLVLVLGAPVFRYYPYVPGPYLPDGTELIHITSDPDEAARAPVGDAFVADVRAAVEAVLRVLEPSDRVPPVASMPVAGAHAEAPLSPHDMFSALDRVAAPDTIWVTEAGSHEQPMDTYIRPGAAFSRMSAAGGGLGFGLPAAVGAQLAAPDRPVLALLGDGSIHYAITALWTAARYRIPVTVVVVSNSQYGILKQFGDLERTPGVPGLDIPGLDIVATARSYGVPAYEARSTDELEQFVKNGLADRSGPVLVNVSTTAVTSPTICGS